MIRFATKSDQPGQCLRRRMKTTSQFCIMLLNPTMNAQQDTGQSLCRKVLIFPVCHLRSHRRSDRIFDIDSHRGTGNRQLRVVDRFHAASYQPSASMSMSARSRWLGRFIASFRSRAACTGVFGKGFTQMPSSQRTSSTSCSGPNSSPHSAGMRNRRPDSIRVTTLDISGPSLGLLTIEVIIPDEHRATLSQRLNFPNDYVPPWARSLADRS